MTLDNQKAEHIFTANHALEAWKHFASTGGADKNTMVTVVSWLLAFSSTIIGYIVTNPLKSDSIVFSKPVATLILAGIGFVTSVAAGLVAIIYGRYARTNWARADQIAEARGWQELLRSGSNAAGRRKPVGLAATAKLVRREHCTRRIAPIFWIFMTLAIMSAVIHLAFLCRSVILMRPFLPGVGG